MNKAFDKKFENLELREINAVKKNVSYELDQGRALIVFWMYAFNRSKWRTSEWGSSEILRI